MVTRVKKSSSPSSNTSSSSSSSSANTNTTTITRSRRNGKLLDESAQREVDSLPNVVIIIPVFRTDDEMYRYYSRLSNTTQRYSITKSGRRVKYFHLKMIKRFATALWKGSIKDGSGVITTQSKVISSLPYNVPSRFGGDQVDKHTNPEELIASAHAGCYSMALSAQLSGAELTPTSINTTATLSMLKDDKGWTITQVDLKCEAVVPNATKELFLEKAKAAKEGCPVSKVLNCKITLDATLKN
ncbi:osmotically inducible family protein [Cavenderia fasciculata]|uniref:Osmotically inducible family protein n=1 Tax=Cavenderia fasciculata TaxID=261658 RepID=F4PVA8_CACFS|nr:osmotically inducible family protein [Cavenderia fasciculata]EGG19922.1 osmotically inducible family protein [Cavenderia fasciculata]|eukprot:XP_004366905.1 osmotically inducible family protein [Cavenderia fasciculata]